VKASAAMFHFLFGINQGACQAADIFCAHIENKKSHALGRFRPNAGKLLKFFNEPG
jgi:hypothetical protein